MNRISFSPHIVATILTILSWSSPAHGDEDLFVDSFQERLSSRWRVTGLKETDYRVRNGGLEVRVQPGPWSDQSPTLRVVVPYLDDGSVVVSAKVTLLDPFTADGEFAGIHVWDEQGSQFRAVKERVAGKIVYAPGAVEFLGKDGEEGDVTKYKTILVAEAESAGPLRILVDRRYAYFQVGPSSSGKFHNHFYSAIRSRPGERGFGVITGGAPAGSSHWVRFEQFRVFERK